MKHALRYTLVLVCLASLASAQYSITALNTPVTENFDGMGTTGGAQGSMTSMSANEEFAITVLPNWRALRRVGNGGSVQLFFGSNDGSSLSGSVYNYGTAFTTASDNNRMIGSLGSGSTTPSFGTWFRNNTGGTITTITVQYLGAQWRTGGRSDVNEVLEFQYRIGPAIGDSSLRVGSWTTVPALAFNELNPTNGTTSGTGSNSAINGNQAQNQVTISGSITGITLAANETIWFRWNDTDNTGGDNGFAVDNLVVTATAGTSNEGETAATAVSTLTTYPNPSAGDFAVEFGLVRAERVSVTLVDLAGAQRQVLAAERAYEPGFHRLNVTTDVAPGLYLVSINTASGRKTTKLAVVR